ncbi:MAG TPA: hypothetical protein VHN11_10675 [Xanthobacteraceae bacterium]|nr:hypothetical protein [Xanthobacteraceae bacterium]
MKLLQIPKTEDETSETIPDEKMGPFSNRNRNGWDVIRRDLPMITKTFYWESPNFGDAATYGTHMHFWDRKVYQREFYEPRNYSILARTLKATSTGGYAIHLRIGQELSRTEQGFKDELLFMLNLLQENCGSAGVVSSSTPPSEYIKTIALDWEVFPPGTATEVVERFMRGKSKSLALDGKFEERVRQFSKLAPSAYLKGSGGFGSYIGAKYADDLVVFENVQYGNALYILYDEWENASKRSRTDLLRGTDANFDRLPHSVGWDEAFENIMRREKKKRGLK